MSERPHCLVFAYACEPGGGSEPGAGWAVVRALADIADVTVLVNPADHEALMSWLATHADVPIRPLPVVEPAWVPARRRRPWQWFVCYLGWLRNATRTARRLVSETAFDAVCHVTYSAYWLPAPATRLGLPSLVGPVGGAVTTPRPLLPTLGVRGMLWQAVELLVVRMSARLPVVRADLRRATVVLSQNQETTRQLRRVRSGPIEEVNHAELLEAPRPRSARGRSILWVSSVESRKGPALAVLALAAAPAHIRLTMIGDGPMLPAVRRRAARLGVTDRLDVRGRLPHDETLRAVRDASVMVFTGLREEGGVALAEALGSGVPVVVLGIGGARDIAQRAHDPSRVAVIGPAGAARTARRLAAAITRLADAASPDTDSLLAGGRARATLAAALATALAASGPSEPGAPARGI